VSGPKSFEISKHAVFEAYRRVKANKGAAGVDGESIELFEVDLKANLYKLWNRCRRAAISRRRCRWWRYRSREDVGSGSSGCPRLRTGSRRRWRPCIWSRRWRASCTPTPTGTGPAAARWTRSGYAESGAGATDWLIDLDIKGFFDNLDHDLVLKAVAHHTDQRWILLYVQRWLIAPLQAQDGSLLARDRGSPQGSAISPLLANLFMHYAFDAWMAREFSAVRFERYCDDVVVHCRSEVEAHQVREAIAERLARCGGLQLHPDKTRIVYCKDGTRRRSHEHTSFTFLGYGFRSRMVKTRSGRYFFGFNPAISDDAAKRIRAQIRSWRLHLRSGWTLAELAREINMVVRGWINYYGRFYRSKLHASLNRINDYLGAVDRAEIQAVPGTTDAGMESPRKGRTGLPEALRPLADRQALTAKRLDDGSRVTGDCHARF